MVISQREMTHPCKELKTMEGAETALERGLSKFFWIC